jgi:hypothetical protein
MPLLAQVWRQPLHRYHPAPGHEAGEGSAGTTEQDLADARVHAVGADECVTLDSFARFEVKRDASFALIERDTTGADTNGVGGPLGKSTDKDRVEVGAVDQPVGEPEADDSIGAEVLHAPGLAGVVQAHFLGGGDRRDRLHRVPQAKFAQHPRAIGRDLHAGADLAQFDGLLEEGDVVALLQQREGGDDTADAGPGDQDAWLAQVPSPMQCVM